MRNVVRHRAWTCPREEGLASSLLPRSHGGRTISSWLPSPIDSSTHTGLRVPVSADVLVSVGDGENIDNAVKRFKREVSAGPGWLGTGVAYGSNGACDLCAARYFLNPPLLLPMPVRACLGEQVGPPAGPALPPLPRVQPGEGEAQGRPGAPQGPHAPSVAPQGQQAVKSRGRGTGRAGGNAHVICRGASDRSAAAELSKSLFDLLCKAWGNDCLPAGRDRAGRLCICVGRSKRGMICPAHEFEHAKTARRKKKAETNLQSCCH